MVLLLYVGLLAATVVWLGRHYRGRTVEGLIKSPPAGSDLNAVVSQLSYLEHELLKHRIPVVQSLMAKRLWNRDDYELLQRTIGGADASMRAELQRYLDGIQRGAGRALVNFARDVAFTRTVHHVESIQRLGERWLRTHASGGPPAGERRPVEEACAWLSGPFRHYLIELNRSVFRSRITASHLEKSARRGLLEAGRPVALEVSEAPTGCIARVLPSDLDIVVRNLVRNAAQIELPEGVEPAVQLEVEERLDETGEESVLIRVHDRSPRRLTSAAIYGRDAHRGLGLVTTALGRHGGAVRCVDSNVKGFAKAMEVRLGGSLHQPDPAAMEVARPGSRAFARPLAAAVVHAALLTLVVAPWLAPHPLNASTLRVPPGCTVAVVDEEAVRLTCDLVSDDGRVRAEPIGVVFDAAAGDPGPLTVNAAACARVDRPEPHRVEVDLAACVRAGELSARVGLRFESVWRRDVFEVRLELSDVSPRLLEGAATALGEGDATIARRLADLVLGSPWRGRSLDEEAEAHWLRGLADVVEVAADRLANRVELDDAALCARFEAVERHARRLLELAQGADESHASRLSVRARVLLAQGTLWLTASPQGALNVLEPVVLGREASGAAQTARWLAAVLISEGVPGSALEPQALLRELWDVYARPPLDAARVGGALGVELIGRSEGAARATGFAVPVPEALCAFREAYPDVTLSPTMAVALAGPCGQREPEASVTAYVAALGRYVRGRPRPLACP